jgi:hypothetical protein
MHPRVGNLQDETGDSEMKTGKRELIDTGKDKRFVRRDAQGRFKESDDTGRSLSRDVRRRAKTKVKAGYGDRGDLPGSIDSQFFVVPPVLFVPQIVLERT